MAACCASGQAQATDSADPISDRFWLSGQANFIRQQHGGFVSPYSGANSLRAAKEHATSRLLTLYTGVHITRRLEFLFDAESAGGAGVGDALGVAGFTNVDVVRNPDLGSAPYVARVMLHGVIPLGRSTVASDRTPLSTFGKLPERRLEVRLGKMSTADFFDVNAVGSDSHLQFLNWTVVNNGAFDYAADTRGYTYGLVLEYDDRWGAFRFGEMLMPKVANGISLDWNLARARAENFELEWHPNTFKERPTVLRLLGFVNHANMGSYREALSDSTPDVTAHRRQGRVKYGFGLNLEQVFTQSWRGFGRLGWNEGANESFAYTEVDRTAEIGSDLFGRVWHRGADKIGAALVTNAISGDHRRYLEAGGSGFLLGDGRLTYGLEQIFEIYYNVHLWRGAYAAIDWQHITNPGYNKDRGPVPVIGFRVHLEGSVPFGGRGQKSP
jgi:high affinity Mn2+ porin